MKFLFIHARVTLASGRVNLKGLLSTSIASVITAAEKLLEEMKHQNESDPGTSEPAHLNRHHHSFNGSLDL